MSDLTLLYYSASVIDSNCGKNVRNELLKTTNGDFPIISVTQKPLDFGENICIGEIGQSYYNMFKQIYTGVQKVKTKYVATVDDDTLYNLEHLNHRPSSDDVFSYNTSMWFLDRDIFWTKKNTGYGFSCISSTEILHATLQQRFERYPVEPIPRNYQKYQWLEPGPHDIRLGFEPRKAEHFHTKLPLITLCHWTGTFGWPKRRERNTTVTESLEHWGNAKELRNRIFGTKEL